MDSSLSASDDHEVVVATSVHVLHPAEGQDSEEQVAAQRIVSCLGDELAAALTASGSIYLSLPALCHALGLNVRGQLQRIQRTSELAVGLRQLPLQTQGGVQRINCLQVDKVGLWLAGIRTQTMKSGVHRDKVESYQAELAPLATHLFLSMLMREQAESETAGPLLPPSDVLWQEGEQALPVRAPSSSATLLDLEQPTLRALLANVPQRTSATSLTTTSFQEDRAIREATLAPRTDWEEEPASRCMRYSASNQLHVYLGDPDHPLSISQALEKIRELGESTVLTARIILGLWNMRRCDNRLSKEGSVAIRADEILEWRGVHKHVRVAYPGASKRFTDGYQWKHKQQVYRDLMLLQQCYLRGQHTVVVKGRRRHFSIDGPYLRVTVVKETTPGEEETIVGYFVAPGAWINTYEEHGNFFLAEIDRRIFQLNPQNQQIALRIALYLSEHWRQQARTGRYQDPIVMQELLAASMVPIDKANLTTRFAPRVEAALLSLCEHGIVSEVRCLTPVDTCKAHWGKEWLAASWSILPPDKSMHHATPSTVAGSASTKQLPESSTYKKRTAQEP